MLALCVLLAISDLPFEEEGSPSPGNENQPQPTPTPEIVPLKNLIGPVEIAALLIGLVYAIFFVLGGRNMSRELKNAEKGVEKLRDYFYVVPSRFIPVTRHEYHIWVTGRRGYLGGFVTISFSKRSDILGWLWDLLRGRRTRVVFEFVCEPERQLAAIFSLRKELLSSQKTYKLEQSVIEGIDLALWTDFGVSKTPFVDAAVNYVKNHPGRLISVDLNDCNRFDTSVAGRFVARIEFEANKGLGVFFDDETVDFVMDIADRFNKLELTDSQYDDNVRARTAMMMEGTGLDAEALTKKALKKKKKQ